MAATRNIPAAAAVTSSSADPDAKPNCPPEFALLCLAARPRADLTRVRAALDWDLDPVLLLQLAEAHGLRPPLLRCLSALAWSGVPAGIRDALEAFQHGHVLRALALADDLRRTAALFGERDLPFAAFKGPVLAMTLHGGLANREYGDLDIVVPRARLAEAERLLATLGYRCRRGDPAFRQAFLGAQRQYEFVRDDGLGAIDLHWAFSGTHVPFPLAPDEIWDDLRVVLLGDRAIPTLSRNALALLLAGHGTKEGWRSLKWVGDFAAMIEQGADLDWAALHGRAGRRGCGDAVLLGCAMAHELLDTPVPTALIRPLENSRRVRTLAAGLADRLREGTAPSGHATYFVDLDLCERPVDRFRSAVKLALRPTPGDYAALPLPPALWPIYRVTRPFRLAAGLLARSLLPDRGSMP